MFNPLAWTKSPGPGHRGGRTGRHPACRRYLSISIKTVVKDPDPLVRGESEVYTPVLSFLLDRPRASWHGSWVRRSCSENRAAGGVGRGPASASWRGGKIIATAMLAGSQRAAVLHAQT